jgi:hypothetical protein
MISLDQTPHLHYSHCMLVSSYHIEPHIHHGVSECPRALLVRCCCYYMVFATTADLAAASGSTWLSTNRKYVRHAVNAESELVDFCEMGRRIRYDLQCLGVWDIK